MSKPRTASRPRRAAPVDLEAVREIALSLPGVEEGTSYGTPAFKVRKKLIARMLEDGESLVIRVDPDARDVLIQGKPETFYITDHYLKYPLMLVRLPAVRLEELRELLEQAFQLSAPRRRGSTQ